MQHELAAQTRRLEEERRTLREEWVERQRKRIAELEKRVADAVAHHDLEMARVVESIKDRELRAQVEKQSRRRAGQVRSETRGETDAAVVAHLSESQPDLGVSGDVARAPGLDELVPGVRVLVRGFSAPVVLRRRDATSADVEAGPLRMKVPLAEITGIVTEEPANAASTRRKATGIPLKPLRAQDAAASLRSSLLENRLRTQAMKLT